MAQITPPEPILIELQPNCDYILLVDPSYVRDSEFVMKAIEHAATIGTVIKILPVADVNRAVKFIQMPKEQDAKKDQAEQL